MFIQKLSSNVWKLSHRKLESEFDKNDTNPVKYCILQHRTAYVLLGMSICILQNNSAAQVSHNTSSHFAEQVV